ncbi:MAG: PilZ domain-containing protein [Kofleriaceae bacterium]
MIAGARLSEIFPMNLLDARRRAPRISIDGFCGVATDDDLTHASLSNLSTLGLRLERPFDPKTARPVIQLEIELPGLDEVVWASAVVTRAVLTPNGRHPDGQPKFWCRAGLAIRDTSRRERKMLHDYIIDKLVDRTPIPDRRTSLFRSEAI